LFSCVPNYVSWIHRGGLGRLRADRRPAERGALSPWNFVAGQAAMIKRDLN
jgi:hypothetical protein